MRKLEGPARYVMSAMCTVLGLFHLYAAFRGSFPPYIQRGVHLLVLLPIIFLIYPATRKSPADRVTRCDLLWACAAALPSIYIVVQRSYLENRIQFVTPVTPTELILGTILILAVLEAVRRAVSPVMAGLIAVFVLYLPLGKYLPGIFYHRGFSFAKIIESIYLPTGEGVYGLLMGISATHIILFIIFGSFIFFIGAGEFFTDFSRMVAGGLVGGPAKIATLSSCLFGSISGSAVANVYATGTFSIPLMKRTGFKPEFAGAVEAAASTGGQIMPPIMGAAAFILAENLSMPYIKVALSALMPALLFYFSIWMMIDFRCRKEGLKGESRDSLPHFKEVRKRLYLFIPIVLLFGMLCLGYSPLLSCFLTILVCIVMSFFQKETYMTPKRIVLTFTDAGSSAAMVAVALAGAGIIVVSVTQTGFALTMGSMILSLAGGVKFLMLILIAVVTIILGMGMPTTAAYVITAALGVAPLIQFGINPLAAHLFIFYFAVMSNITPPVAIAAYAGANIAKSDPMKTGWEAFIVAMAGYIVPFMFVYSPILVLQEGTAAETAVACITATFGVVILAAALQGWFLGKLAWWMRGMLFAAALGLIIPGALTDLFGVAVTATIFCLQKFVYYRSAPA